MHDGFIGLNTLGDKVTPTAASSKLATISLAGPLFFLPMVASAGESYELGQNPDTLIFEKWDWLYGFGERLRCEYDRQDERPNNPQQR